MFEIKNSKMEQIYDKQIDQMIQTKERLKEIK